MKLPGGYRSKGNRMLCAGVHALSFNYRARGGRVARGLSAIRWAASRNAEAVMVFTPSNDPFRPFSDSLKGLQQATAAFQNAFASIERNERILTGLVEAKG